jgi:hypothetical protein
LNGHIHQIVQKVEGNMTFHTARSTAYPQPVAGDGPGPSPLKGTATAVLVHRIYSNSLFPNRCAFPAL